MSKTASHIQKISKTVLIEKKINRYCANHPLITWFLLFICMPIAILLVVAICASIFALPFLLIA